MTFDALGKAWLQLQSRFSVKRYVDYCSKNEHQSKFKIRKGYNRFTEQGKRKSTAEEPRVARCGDNFALFSRLP